MATPLQFSREPHPTNSTPHSQAPRAERGSGALWKGEEGDGPSQQPRTRDHHGHWGGGRKGGSYPVRAPQGLRAGQGVAAAAGAAAAGTGARDSFLKRRNKLSLAFKAPPAGHRILRCGAWGHWGRTHGSWLWKLIDVKANCWVLGCNSSTAPALAGPLPPIPRLHPFSSLKLSPRERPLTSSTQALAKTFY